MIILFILGILLGIVSVFFALQNVTVVTVSFLNWSLTSSLSIVVLLSILSGIVIMLLLFLPGNINNYFIYRKLKRDNSKLHEELKKQKELTVFAKNNPPTHEDIAKIEDGVIEEHKV